MFQSKDFRHTCNTLNACYLRTLPVIDDFISCLGFAPTDLDGLVESNGKFLVLEFKDWRAPRMNTLRGQGLALRRLAELPDFHVLVIRSTPDPEMMRVQWMKHEMEDHDRTREEVCAALSDWKAWTKQWDAEDFWTAPWARA
jgi:hypothetical protein